MTDPQIPCRDCKRPTQHATERCDDCRTPAGRLVTALRGRGVKALPPEHAATGDENVRVDGMTECMPGLGNGYALDAAIRKHAGWEPAGVGGAHKAGWVGRLAAGEVDDG